MSKPFRSDKRRKELQRLKKQEEKRQRRFGLKKQGEEAGETEHEAEDRLTETENGEAGSEGSPEATSESENTETQTE